LVGKKCKLLISLFNRVKGNAIGPYGKDKTMIIRWKTGVDLGYVGEVTSIDTSVLKAIVEHGSIHVIASVAADENDQVYDFNVDITMEKNHNTSGCRKAHSTH